MAYLFAPFLLVFLIVRAFGITFQDLVFLIRSPGAVLGIFFDERLKRNHALEHATLNVLEENEKDAIYDNWEEIYGVSKG